jgi:hypothetical protein
MISNRIYIFMNCTILKLSHTIISEPSPKKYPKHPNHLTTIHTINKNRILLILFKFITQPLYIHLTLIIHLTFFYPFLSQIIKHLNNKSTNWYHISSWISPSILSNSSIIFTTINIFTYVSKTTIIKYNLFFHLDWFNVFRTIDLSMISILLLLI